MTEEEIRAATPDGLRLLVARVLGWTRLCPGVMEHDYHGHPPRWGGDISYPGPVVPDWSNDMNLALTLDDSHWVWDMADGDYGVDVLVWDPNDSWHQAVIPLEPMRQTKAQTYATARCRAFLLMTLKTLKGGET